MQSSSLGACPLTPEEHCRDDRERDADARHRNQNSQQQRAPLSTHQSSQSSLNTDDKMLCWKPRTVAAIWSINQSINRSIDTESA